MQTLKEILADLEITIESMIPLIGSWVHPSEELRELVEDGWEDECLIAAGATQRQLNRLRKDEDWDMISEFLREKEIMKTLVQVATPVPSGVQLVDGKLVGGHYSWGHYQTKWHAVDSLEDLVSVLPEWRDDIWKKSAKEDSDS